MKTIQTRRARSTGTLVQLIDNRGGSFEAFEGSETSENMRWATLCDDHGNYCLHSTRALASSFAAAPEEWCEDCQALLAWRARVRGMSITEKLDKAIAEQKGRIALAESRIARKLETGECSQEQAERSTRATVGRMKARLGFLERSRTARETS